MVRVWLPKWARERATYAVMSLLVTWHTGAILVQSAPDCDITNAARAVYGPYLALFRLNNRWDFFAPNVNTGEQFRYVVSDGAGNQHSFTPDEKLSRFLPSSIWFMDWFKNVMAAPDLHGDAAAAALCLEHASLDPVEITLVRARQKEFWPSDRLGGHDPLDPDFVDVETLKTVRCPGK